jgi:uncharacterized membrane protein
MGEKAIEENRSIDLFSIVLIFATWVLLVSLFVWTSNWFSGELGKSPEQLGQFGDFFGGIINPLFSLASFVLLIRTLTYTRGAFKVSLESINVTRQQVVVAMDQLKFEYEKHRNELTEDEKRSRRELTITWHQNWMSPEMTRLKLSVYGEIETCISSIESGQHAAFMGGRRTSGNVQFREKYHGIKYVMLHIHQAITYFDDGLLDKDLFLKLFAADFRQWHSVLSRLDMKIDTRDVSQDSLSEETERRDLVERLARVIGL